MILRLSIACILSFILMDSFSQPIWATMGGISNVGPVFNHGDSSTTIRELVELEKLGEFLVAKPRHNLVTMITLYAPGLSRGHLILRELLTQEGKLTLLLTAPDSVMTHVQRVTLYTRGLHENIVLFENVNGVWEKRLPQHLVIDSPIAGDMSSQTLRVFSLQNLGFYWLLESAAVPFDISHFPEVTSAKMLMGGKLLWGFLPSVFGIMFFILFGALSRYIHKTTQ